jgi:30S ribosomal protein S31
MGKGDKKTKKGKISMGSHGNSRPRKSNAAAASPKKEKVKAVPKVKAEAAPKAEKKAPAKKAAKKAE